MPEGVSLAEAIAANVHDGDDSRERAGITGKGSVAVEEAA
jgi:hypothetical protein